VGAYLRAQNRPYSAIQLHDNLHGRVNKALMESALAALVEGGSVCRKDYGKAAIFWPAQGAFAAVTQEEVAALNAKMEQLEAAAAAAGAARRAAEARLAALTAGPSGAALESALAEARARMRAAEAALVRVRAREAELSKLSEGAALLIQNYARRWLEAQQLRQSRAESVNGRVRAHWLRMSRRGRRLQRLAIRWRALADAVLEALVALARCLQAGQRERGHAQRCSVRVVLRHVKRRERDVQPMRQAARLHQCAV
jgi:hypothetical protein